MAWSIFSQGGGNPAAVSWAEQLLAAVGAPITQANTQFVYDWEKAEGGGGKNNPLNQGPVPGHPELTTTGSQYGGGAADFASPAAGVAGAAAYLHMPAYSGVLQGLMTGNAAGARSALIASPWASSHYGGGATFPTTALPGTFDPTAGGTPAPAAGSATNVGLASNLAGNLFAGAAEPIISWVDSVAVRALLVVAGAVAVMVGLVKLTGSSSNSSSSGGSFADRMVAPPSKAAARKARPAGPLTDDRLRGLDPVPHTPGEKFDSGRAHGRQAADKAGPFADADVDSTAAGAADAVEG